MQEIQTLTKNGEKTSFDEGMRGVQILMEKEDCPLIDQEINRLHQNSIESTETLPMPWRSGDFLQGLTGKWKTMAG
jgi:hypothetical protein